ncbi:hypothetical protein [Flavobacterium oreochromis]|uniref:Uncharacterized protein n=1 Tax=Flavobacterium oreochromis TaxID=2906078 RepID=A0ABW8PBG4_9FLAO|nr:hypothetical protein [Flavobacterium oreochromis]QYS86899.1 hypothetical protein JJC03_02520 [Flavobacterium oreochromis]
MDFFFLGIIELKIWFKASINDKNYNAPLISKDSVGKIRTFGLQLYRSIKTGKLEVY